MSKLYPKSFSTVSERTRQYEWAVNGLATVNEVHSCRNLWNGNHWFNGGIMLILLVGLIITQYTGLILFLNALSFSYFFYRFIVTLIGMGGDPDAGEMVEYSDDLPTYCILLPMRNEPLTVVSHLIENINNLNYPKDKLDVIMLVDQDDDYLGDILEMPKPKHFRIVSSAATFPFTKPKVCNLGLADTDAEYVTVYDVEDNPEPNQLLKVLYKFNENNADCVQCRLHYNNEKPNLQAKFFNLEYLTWFTMTITGLHKVQGDRAVIPLGGTSQHLRTETLKELGGWDAYNVTEDCDLGIRLARTGKSTVISDSVTDEIAIEGLSDFVKQRTRWQMGFMVTYITHCRDIFNLYRELGIWRFFHFIMFVLGNVLNKTYKQK